MIWVWVPVAFVAGLWIGFRWSLVGVAHIWKSNPSIVLDKLGYSALVLLGKTVEDELAKRKS